MSHRKSVGFKLGHELKKWLGITGLDDNTKRERKQI